ncbi:MAG: hypothetical protein IJ599_01540 [Alphaproteobacteria bacterium]|nr:hypothetical protein [Alphaproteobacteria bacterium]
MDNAIDKNIKVRKRLIEDTMTVKNNYHQCNIIEVWMVEVNKMFVASAFRLNPVDYYFP